MPACLTITRITKCPKGKINEVGTWGVTSKELRHKLTQGQGKEIGGALQPHHTQASEQLGRTYTAHCNTLFIEIAKTDQCSTTVILFAHRVCILYIF